MPRRASAAPPHRRRPPRDPGRRPGARSRPGRGSGIGRLAGTLHLPRAARGALREHRHGPLPRPGSGSRGPAARVLGRPARRRGVRGPRPRGGRCPPRRPSSRTSRSSRPSDRPGWPPSSGSGPTIPADMPVVIDAKRGDIGSTAARQAVALFDGLGADAITVSPYLGEEAIAPLLERVDRFAYVLCRTSNPGAAELQGLRVEADRDGGQPAEPLYARVARRASSWGPGGTVGLVVGATAPARAGRDPDDRRRAWHSSCRASARRVATRPPCSVTDGPRRLPPAAGPVAGLLVNVSRGIAGAGRAPGDRAEGTARPPGMPCATPSRKPRAAGLPACPCYPSQRVSPARRRPREQTRSKPTDMPNIGPVELIIILVIALIVIGPGRLPDVGAALGKSIRSSARPPPTSPTPPASTSRRRPPPRRRPRPRRSRPPASPPRLRRPLALRSPRRPWPRPRSPPLRRRLPRRHRSSPHRRPLRPRRPSRWESPRPHPPSRRRSPSSRPPGTTRLSRLPDHAAG